MLFEARRAGPWLRRSAALLAAAAVAAVAAVCVLPALPAAAAPVVSTAFPGVQVQPGKSIDFPLTVSESSTSYQRVALSVTGVPSGWKAVLSGSGFQVSETYANNNNPQNPDLKIQVPAGAPAGVYHMSVVGRAPDGTWTLPLTVDVSQQAASRPSLTAQYPSLKGPDSGKFQFQVTLNNNGLSNENYALSGHAPQGWQVTFAPQYASKEIGAIPVKAGQSQTLDVNVTPAANAPTGAYQVVVSATAAGQQARVPLQVDLIGTYNLAVSTPSGNLDASATAGRVSSVAVVVQNNGTADLTNISLTATAPPQWAVTFKPSHINLLAGHATQQVVMTVQPNGSAIAGDYDVTANASDPQATANQDFRVTVHTSTLWGWIGVLIVLAVIGGLWYMFQRLGRR